MVILTTLSVPQRRLT